MRNMFHIISGIILVMLETELRFCNIITEKSVLSRVLKVIMSLLTCCLLLSIVSYHVTGMRLHMATAGFRVMNY